MADKNNFFQSLFGRKANKSFLESTSFRNKPYEGATDNMLDFLLNSSFDYGTANWNNLSNEFFLLKCYENNPIVNAVINIKAEAWANMKFVVEYNDEDFDLEDFDADGGILKELLLNPNPIQSSVEWLKSYKINYAVYGNSYVYASIPEGFSSDNFTYQDVSVMNNIPSSNIKPKITGNILEATTKEEIVEHYKYTNLSGESRVLDTNKVWHSNLSNIRFDENFTKGVSKLVALTKPISNIDGALETRNVMIYQRGAMGILSSEKKDEGLGTIAMDEEEIFEVQKQFTKYGTLKGQYNNIISPLPLKYQRIAMSPKELLLFEEIESNAIAIANAYKVPEILVKYYVKGATFENIEASEKRLYNSTIIPEANEFIKGLNSFLKTNELGFRIKASFDHVPCLQNDKKDEATTNNINAKTYLEAFKNGAINYNTYLKNLNLPEDPEIGELRVWDLEIEKLQAMGIILVAKDSSEEEGEEENPNTNNEEDE